MISGEEVKNAIRGNGFTIEEAAKKMGISSRTLHNYINKEVISKSFLMLIKNKLGIDMLTGGMVYLEKPKEDLLVDILQLKAIVKTLMHRIVKMEAHEQGRDLSDVFDELENDILLNLKDSLGVLKPK